MTLLVLSTAHRLFGLITWLPQNVIQWIGQQHHNLGDGLHDAEQSKQGMAVVMGKIETKLPRQVGGSKMPTK